MRRVILSIRWTSAWEWRLMDRQHVVKWPPPAFQLPTSVSSPLVYEQYPWAERKLRNWITYADPVGQPGGPESRDPCA